MSKRKRSWVLGVGVVGLVGAALPAGATVYRVDGPSATCDDAGPGDAVTPVCTIGAAAAIAVAGDTVEVAPGTYPERVIPANSGAAGFPITYRATGPGTVVLGSVDLSTATWAPAGGTVFSTSYVPTPGYVLVDGGRLGEAASLATIAAGQWYYDNVPNLLYVDLGGDSPALHAVQVGKLGFGFDLVGKSHLVVDGFEVRGQTTTAIRAVSGSSNVVIRNNRTDTTGTFGILVQDSPGGVEIRGNDVSQSGHQGLRIRSSSGLVISGNVSHHNGDHGIQLTASSDNTIEGNTFHHNAVPGGVSATGLDIDQGSHRNVVRRNVAYGNQDAGFEISGGSNDNVLARNLSYGNADHGFDVRDSNGSVAVSNTSADNARDGISVEGAVTNARLANNVSVNNGVLSNYFDLWIDAQAWAGGVTTDYSVLWNAGPQPPIKVNGTAYASAAALAAATGAEPHGVSGDPLFANPAASDYHIGLGAAVDGADAGAPGFEALDLDGRAPIDLTGVADTGAGVPTYADRGAYERRDTAPKAVLVVSPSKTGIGQTVRADASGSRDDSGIVSYRFDFGDGRIVTQPGPVATHAYARKATFHIRVTVTDGAGLSASAQKPVQVR